MAFHEQACKNKTFTQMFRHYLLHSKNLFYFQILKTLMRKLEEN